MSAERRLAKLEGTLTPKAATLLWLTEAHGFSTLRTYVAWLIDQPASAAPLVRVPEAAEGGVRAALRGEKHDAVERAVREAVRQAVFLVEFVIRLNTAAEEAIRILSLRSAALFWQLRAISAEARLETAGPSRGMSREHAARWSAWRGAVAGLIGDLYVAEEARAHLDRRYLDGSPTLFPDLAADWQALREQAERLAGLGDGAEGRPLRWGRRATPPSGVDRSTRRTADRERAQAEAAHLADMARSAALDLLGDTDGAAAIAERRLRLGDR